MELHDTAGQSHNDLRRISFRTPSEFFEAHAKYETRNEPARKRAEMGASMEKFFIWLENFKLNIADLNERSKKILARQLTYTQDVEGAICGLKQDRRRTLSPLRRHKNDTTERIEEKSRQRRDIKRRYALTIERIPAELQLNIDTEWQRISQQADTYGIGDLMSKPGDVVELDSLPMQRFAGSDADRHNQVLIEWLAEAQELSYLADPDAFLALSVRDAFEALRWAKQQLMEIDKAANEPYDPDKAADKLNTIQGQVQENVFAIVGS